MRRREFEITCRTGINLRTGEPGVFYRVVDRRRWLDWLILLPRRVLYFGANPADCYQWIERYRRAEAEAAAFRG